MFYTAESNDHGLPHDPFKAIVAPRPIGWIGTRNAEGVSNLAPYSFFNVVSGDPKIVMFASDRPKHSFENAARSGVFTVSLASRDLADAVNLSSAPVDDGVSEFSLAGVTPALGRLVDAPYVAEAHAALECRVTQLLRPLRLDGGEAQSYLVFGQVVGIHLSDRVLRDGRLAMDLARPIGRMGYMDYDDAASGMFEMARPGAKR